MLFALGTDMGIRAIVASGEYGETEARPAARAPALHHGRQPAGRRDEAGELHLRGTRHGMVGRGTACTSDSKKFGSWSSNFMTEYHARYGGNGVMIYWHVERKNVCIYSQLKSCSSSRPRR
ncbi:hypothetical protein GCM10023100_04600 [Actinocorallia cavernae]|uniref:Tn3 transposase DDE domain-containing protein n=2 Tax=Actinomycetes TaxID=1760 RepID=A0ABP5Y912_9ACTN